MRSIALLLVLVAADPAQTAQGQTAPAEAAVDLQTALTWTLERNPDLVTRRQDLCVSAAALAVARQFPTSLNPSVGITVDPWVWEPASGQGATPLQTLVSIEWTQPVALGHRTALRTAIARADYTQTRWNVLQAELIALVATYRLHQTATYRREKLHVADELAESNAQLVEALRRRVAASQAGPADLALAEVESQTVLQQSAIARQEYLTALADLRRQIGIPEYAASIEPAGDLVLPEPTPIDETQLVESAVNCLPEVQAARARAVATRAGVALARADRIPVPSLGPHYEKDESGTTFYGMAMSCQVPVLNTGARLAAQRETEYRRDCVALAQLEARTVASVRAALACWHETGPLAMRTAAGSQSIRAQVDRMDHLFQAGQADLIQLVTVRQRLIAAENARLDTAWQATQAYADLLESTGVAALLSALSAPALGDGNTRPVTRP